MRGGVEDERYERRLSWDALSKSIHRLVNMVNPANLKSVVFELFGDNLIRGREIFSRCLMMASPNLIRVVSAVVSSKIPQIGELVKFIAHLVNQQVGHELIPLELVTVLVKSPTDHSFDVAVGLVGECEAILQKLSPKVLLEVFERLRGILLQEGDTGRSVSVRIFIKILLQELSQHFGIHLLNNNLQDQDQGSFDSIFLIGISRQSRIDINLFISIQLGAIIQNLLDYLRTMPRQKPESKSEKA